VKYCICLRNLVVHLVLCRSGMTVVHTYYYPLPLYRD
jgi:hypothetical protein